MNELCVTLPVCGIPVLSLKQVRILSFHDSQSVCVVPVTLQYAQLSFAYPNQPLLSLRLGFDLGQLQIEQNCLIKPVRR